MSVFKKKINPGGMATDRQQKLSHEYVVVTGKKDHLLFPADDIHSNRKCNVLIYIFNIISAISIRTSPSSGSRPGSKGC